MLSAPGLGDRIHWHHLSQWSRRRTFCRERWWTKWWRFDHHERWPTAKEAEEDSEPGVSLLLRFDLFIFRYLVICFKINLGIYYHTFYDFSWFSGILVSWGENSGYIGIHSTLPFTLIASRYTRSFGSKPDSKAKYAAKKPHWKYSRGPTKTFAFQLLSFPHTLAKKSCKRSFTQH